MASSAPSATLGAARPDRKEDFTGADSPYLLRNGVKIWGPQSMSKGGSASMSLAVSSGDRLTLMEYDWPDADDNLATLTVTGTGPYNFTGSGAHYILNIVGF